MTKIFVALFAFVLAVITGAAYIFFRPKTAKTGDLDKVRDLGHKAVEKWNGFLGYLKTLFASAKSDSEDVVQTA